MPAKKPTGYVVTGALAIVTHEGRQRYLYRGAEFSADTIDEDNAKHLLEAGLIEQVEAAKPAAAEK